MVLRAPRGRFLLNPEARQTSNGALLRVTALVHLGQQRYMTETE